MWEAAPGSAWRDQQGGSWLVWRLPSWTVLAYAPDFPNLAATIEGGRAIANGLRPRQTTDGFMVVADGGPVELSHEPGEGLGATLVFGDGDPRESSAGTDEAFRMVILSPDPNGCEPGGQESVGGDTEYGSMCIGEGPRGALFVSVYGPKEFVRGVTSGLTAEDVRVPSS
jgi:hypothetical protein